MAEDDVAWNDDDEDVNGLIMEDDNNGLILVDLLQPLIQAERTQRPNICEDDDAPKRHNCTMTSNRFTKMMMLVELLFWLLLFFIMGHTQEQQQKH